MFESKCGACHSESNSLAGLDLTNYEGALEGGESGAVILAGDPENSRLIIIQNSDEPHFAQLTTEELDLVVDWIANGAAEN